MTSSASMTLLTACLNPGSPNRPHSDKSGEYLRLRRHGNVAGMTVQQKVVTHDGHDQFGLYKHFTTDIPPQASEIVIHSGHGQDRMEQARYHTYTNRDHWELNNGGETCRVVNAQGLEVDRKAFPANHCDVLPPAPAVPRPKPPLVSAAAGVAFGEDR